MITPTLRLRWLGAAVAVLGLLPAIVEPRIWPLAVVAAVALLAVSVVDLLMALPPDRIEVLVDLPSLLYIGDRDPLTITLTTPTWGLASRVEMLVEVDDHLAELPSRLVVVPPRGTVEIDLELVPRRRGEAELRAVWLRWAGPLGLLRRAERRPYGETARVVPDVRAVRTAALRYAPQSLALGGRRIGRLVGDGSEFESLAEFTQGMDSRRMDWKATARQRRLMCREHRIERNQSVYVAVDCGHLMGEPLDGVSRLDRAINAALVLAYVCLKTGDRVGIYGFDERVRLHARPRRGVASFSHVESALATLRCSSSETNFTLGIGHLMGQIRRRSLVVLFTDFVDTITAELMVENALRLARRNVIIFVALRDPALDATAHASPVDGATLHRAVVARDLMQERELVLRRLRKLGVFTLDVLPEDVSPQLVDRYLQIKRRDAL